MYKKLHIIFIVVFLFLGCSVNENGPETEMWNNIIKSNKLPEKFSEINGIDLPVDIELLYHGNEDGRVCGYYNWLIVTSREFNFNNMRKRHIRIYNSISLETSVKIISNVLNNKKIKNATFSFHFNWDYNGYQFRGLLLVTDDANYFFIERFKDVNLK